MSDSEYTCKEAVVLDTDGEFARVIVKRSSACDHCAQSGSCVALAGGGDVEVKKARNLAGASGGEKVELRLQGRTLVTGAFLLYLLPLLMMALIIAAAVEIGPKVGLNISPDVLVLIAAVVGLAGSVPLVRLISRKVKSLQNTIPDVTRII